MKARIAILAALPREIGPLIRDWPAGIASRRDGTFLVENDRAIAVCAGMGRERAAHAFALAETCGPLRAIFSVGYAGALREGIARYTIHWPAMVIDAETGERYECAGGNGTLVTTKHVLAREDKPQMAARWSADLVDMEAAAVARVARLRGLPFRALKAVSDEVDDMLPDLNPFIDAHGGFREAAFTRHLMLHPWRIPAAIRLGQNSKKASQAVAMELCRILENAE